MPIYLPPISRRDWLAGVGATAATLLVRGAPAADAGQETFLALLSDTHVPSRRTIVSHVGNTITNMTGNLERVVAEMLETKVPPSQVLINGDCVYQKGLEEDYRALAPVLAPLRDKEVPVHLSMGNHDDRQRMYAQFKEQQPDKPVVEGRVISVLQLPQANWFLLDSLFQTNVTPGELGQPQLKWLAEALDRHADKPAVVMAHHHLQWAAVEPVAGLKDTAELWEILTQRKWVKAYFYGHTHRWHHTQREGIHLVNLPTTAYVFAEGQPNGWVGAHLKVDGMTLELHTLDKRHKQNGERVELAWR